MGNAEKFLHTWWQGNVVFPPSLAAYTTKSTRTLTPTHAQMKSSVSFVYLLFFP